MTRQEDHDHRSSCGSERAYRFLLKACPPAFRESHGPQTEQAFGDMRREERYRGAFGLVRLWGKTLPDLALTAVAERSRIGAVVDSTPWRARARGSDLVIALILLIFSFIIAFAISLAIVFLIAPGSLEGSLSLFEFSIFFFLTNLAIVLSIVMVAKAESTTITLRSIGLRRTSAWWLFAGAFLGLVCWTIGSVIGALYLWISGDALYGSSAEFVAVSSEASVPELILFYFVGVLFFALTDELLFRGVLYTYLRRWGIRIAAPVSALVFGLSVFSTYPHLFASICVGVILALVYERSGSLWPAVACAATISTLGAVFGGFILYWSI